MRAYLIWNRMAGQRDVRRPLEEAVEALEAKGWSVRLCETVHAGDGTHWARQAVADGAQVALAAGGDGTINELVNGLVGSDVALGVLPTGTGNVWAKEMGLPAWVPPYRNPLREAALGLLDASVRAIDVGCANGRYFLLWTGVGFDAEVAHEVEPLMDLRHRLGNLLYAISGLSVAMSFVGTRCRLVIDGQPIRQRVVMIIISNIQLYGAGLFRLAPAYLDDGYLDANIFLGHGPAATFHHFFSLLTQYSIRDPRAIHYRARRVEIYADKPMPVQVDGDASGRTPLIVEAIPQALKILVPPTAPASLFQKPVVFYAR